MLSDWIKKHGVGIRIHNKIMKMWIAIRNLIGKIGSNIDKEIIIMLWKMRSGLLILWPLTLILEMCEEVLFLRTLKGRYNIGNVGELLLWVCLLSLNQDIHWRKGTALVMLRKLLLWVCLLFESRYTLKGRYTIGSVGKTASMSMLTLFESRYTLKRRYNIGNVGELLLWVCLPSLNQHYQCCTFPSMYWREGTTLVMLANCFYDFMLTLFESRYTINNLRGFRSTRSPIIFMRNLYRKHLAVWQLLENVCFLWNDWDHFRLGDWNLYQLLSRLFENNSVIL